MVGSWYVLVMCEKEPLLWTPPLPSNGLKTSKCGGIFTKKQSAALTLEARIMNFIVLNPQVIPNRTGPSRQVMLGRRLPMSTYRLVCLFGSRSSRKKKFFFKKRKFANLFYPYYQYFRRYVCLLGSRSSRKKTFCSKKKI